MLIFGETTADRAVEKTTEVFERTTGIFDTRSLTVFLVALTLALLVGRFIAFVMRRVVLIIGARADKTEDLRTVNRLRRLETYIVLSIALVRAGLVIFAFYFWWVYVHPAASPTALIGAGALTAILISGAIGPILRDLAAGSFMMAEQWYGVGDHIKVEPFADAQGVVERVTLRSTRIRGLNGEIIWLNNQAISGVRVTPKGIRTLALELFVDNLKAGERLIEMTNKRLPIGPLLVVTPLQIVTSEAVGDNLWHITAVGDTAPGREWLLEQSAVDLIKSLDEKRKTPVIAHGPLFRYADSEAESRFRRTIQNARKRPVRKRRHVPKPSAKRVTSRSRQKS